VDWEHAVLATRSSSLNLFISFPLYTFIVLFYSDINKKIHCVTCFIFVNLLNMKIASWNVNGIRACWDKGFKKWFEQHSFDVISLQEVRAEEKQLPVGLCALKNYHANWFAAEKKGYSGVGIISKEKPRKVIKGINVKKFDSEGRVITCFFDSLIVVSAYFPNSQDGGKRIKFKTEFCQAVSDWINELRTKNKKVVVLNGDFNIAHKPIDLARPKENEKTAGYLPEERQWMEEFIKSGWVDTFRYLHPEAHERYSWWSARTRARERNIGWRIDYNVIHKKDVDHILEVDIQEEVMGSDHCPVTLTLDLSL
jgi:exodeoxyribonuclease III